MHTQPHAQAETLNCAQTTHVRTRAILRDGGDCRPLAWHVLHAILVDLRDTDCALLCLNIEQADMPWEGTE
jgi:hypothetical protein